MPSNEVSINNKQAKKELKLSSAQRNPAIPHIMSGKRIGERIDVSVDQIDFDMGLAELFAKASDAGISRANAMALEYHGGHIAAPLYAVYAQGGGRLAMLANGRQERKGSLIYFNGEAYPDDDGLRNRSCWLRHEAVIANQRVVIYEANPDNPFSGRKGRKCRR